MRYLDNGDGEALLNRTNETTQNHLQEGTTDYYAFRAKYTFSETDHLPELRWTAPRCSRRMNI